MRETTRASGVLMVQLEGAGMWDDDGPPQQSGAVGCAARENQAVAPLRCWGHFGQAHHQAGDSQVRFCLPLSKDRTSSRPPADWRSQGLIKDRGTP